MTGIEAIAAERKRQIEEEGWTPEHDDAHTNGELVKAARSYAWLAILGSDRVIYRSRPPVFWPWHSDWWKPRTSRDDLVRAGALIAAEIDRLDRANPPDETPAGIGSPPQFPDGTPIPKDHHSHPDNRE